MCPRMDKNVQTETSPKGQNVAWETSPMRQKEESMKSLKEIHKIREEKRKELDLRVNTKADTREKHILVCHGTGCTSSKSPEILENFRRKRYR